MAIDSYIASVTSEHIDKPNFIAWLSQNIKKVDDVYLAIKEFDTNFDIDNAVGAQLDVLGVLIGRKRVLSFQPISGVSPVLDDETFRFILRAKIAMNSWDGTIPQMYQIWANTFADIKLQIQDNQDMTINAYIIGYIDELKQNLIQEGYIIPKPEGVKLNYITPSVIPFVPYSGIVISEIQTSIINMSKVTYW